MSLCKEFRPKRLEDVVGQSEATLSISNKISNYPAATLFHGPTGTGKTTLAHIVCDLLGCKNGPDRKEINAADSRGIDSIREVSNQMDISGLTGNYKVWIYNEVQQFTSAAVSILLDIVEQKIPDHVKFMFTTTDPQKLPKSLRDRCFQVKLKLLVEEDLIKLLETICKKASLKESSKVLREIANKSEGSARSAVQLLDDIKELEREEEKLKVIRSRDVSGWSRTIAQMLMDTNVRWKDVADQLKEKSNEEAENIRLGVMGYARAILLNGSSKEKMERAGRILKTFESLYDTGLSRLTCYCWDVVSEN